MKTECLRNNNFLNIPLPCCLWISVWYPEGTPKVSLVSMVSQKKSLLKPKTSVLSSFFPYSEYLVFRGVSRNCHENTMCETNKWNWNVLWRIGPKISWAMHTANRFLSPSRPWLAIYRSCARFTFLGSLFQRGKFSGSACRQGRTDDDYRLSDVNKETQKLWDVRFLLAVWWASVSSLTGNVFRGLTTTERFWEGARSHHRGSIIDLHYFCTLPHGHRGLDGADDGRFGFGSKTFSKKHIKT